MQRRLPMNAKESLGHLWSIYKSSPIIRILAFVWKCLSDCHRLCLFAELMQMSQSHYSEAQSGRPNCNRFTVMSAKLLGILEMALAQNRAVSVINKPSALHAFACSPPHNSNCTGLYLSGAASTSAAMRLISQRYFRFVVSPWRRSRSHFGLYCAFLSQALIRRAPHHRQRCSDLDRCMVCVHCVLHGERVLHLFDRM